VPEQPVRVGIVGYGSIGKIHAEALARCSGAQLVGIAGRDEYRQLLARPDVDLVCLCTPSGLHGRQALEALAAGKHVVVEKPLALTLAEGQALVSEAAGRGLFLSVFFQRRLEPHHLYVKEAVESGRLGRPVLAEALVRWHRPQSYYDSAAWRGTRELDGGVLMNQAIHYVDLLRWLMGPVAEVSGATATLTHRMESEDTAAATLRFASGALGLVAATTSAWPGAPAELNLFFERGQIRVCGPEVTRWEVPDLPPPAPVAVEQAGSVTPAAPVAGHLALWAELLSALREGRAPLVTPQEALDDLAVVLGVYEASRTGQAVQVRCRRH
jgi:predicted dehydrogenase